MDFIANPFRFSSSSSPSFGNLFERVRDICCYAVSAILGNVLSAIFTFFFALGLFLIHLLHFFASFLCVYVMIIIWSRRRRRRTEKQGFWNCSLLFLAVGTLLGAMTGALIGQETESGFVRGAAVGAISGAVFSIEVFESSLVLWQSDESGIGCLLYLVSKLCIQIFWELKNGFSGNPTLILFVILYRLMSLQAS